MVYYDSQDSRIYLLARDSLKACFEIKYTENFQIMYFHSLLTIMNDYLGNQ